MSTKIVKTSVSAPTTAAATTTNATKLVAQKPSAPKTAVKANISASAGGGNGSPATLADYKAFIERQKDRMRGVGLTQLARSATVSAIAWNHDGTRLAVSVNDGTVLSYTYDEKDASSSTNEWTSSKTQSHTQEVTSIAWHPQSDTLATVGYDKAVKVWDIRNKKLAADYSTRTSNFTVEWKPNDCSLLFYADRDSKITALDTRTWKPVINASAPENEGDVYAMRATRDGRHLLVCTNAGMVHIYAITPTSLEHKLSLTAHSAGQSCYELALSRDGNMMVTGGSDALVTVWETNTLTCRYTYDCLTAAVRSISISHDDQLIAAHTDTHSIDVLHAPTGKRVHTMACDFEVSNVVWHPRQLLLAFAALSNRDRDRDQPTVIKLWQGGNVKV